MIIKLVGWGVLLTFGVYLQKKKFISLLYRPKPQNIAILFRFALSSSVTVDNLEKRKLNYVSSFYSGDKYKIEDKKLDETYEKGEVTINKTRIHIEDSTRRDISKNELSEFQ